MPLTACCRLNAPSHPTSHASQEKEEAVTFSFDEKAAQAAPAAPAPVAAEAPAPAAPAPAAPKGPGFFELMSFNGRPETVRRFLRPSCSHWYNDVTMGAARVSAGERRQTAPCEVE